MRQTLLTFLIAVALLGACGPKSTLSPDAGVSVTGRVDDSTGAPQSGASVLLIEEPDLGQVLDGVLAIGTTLGLACLSPQPPSLCTLGHQTTTDATGGFAFSLTGAETQGSVGEADTFDLASSEAAGAGQVSGPSSSEQFVINTSSLALPDLRFWAPSVGFTGTSTTASVTFDALPASYGGAAQTDVSFATASGTLVWAQAAASGDALDARLLEDATGGVSVIATASGSAADTAVTFTYQSAGAAFSGGAGPAPSRGAACFEQGQSGPVAIVPCTLTDGDFGTPVALQTCSGSACGASSPTLNNWAYVDLGASRTISLVVVRGTVSGVLVETSSDASSWTDLSQNAQSGVFSLPATGSVRYVRVRSSSATGDVRGLAEISVW
jgi:hypothetical protein